MGKHLGQTPNNTPVSRRVFTRLRQKPPAWNRPSRTHHSRCEFTGQRGSRYTSRKRIQSYTARLLIAHMPALSAQETFAAGQTEKVVRDDIRCRPRIVLWMAAPPAAVVRCLNRDKYSHTRPTCSTADARNGGVGYVEDPICEVVSIGGGTQKEIV